jgi:hypothetical protein
MDERLRTFLLVLGGGAFLGLLGALFGAVTGACYWCSGKAAGTAAGLGVARAFDRAGGRKVSRLTRGLLVGAVDGFLFLGGLGVVIGAVLAHSRQDRAEVLLPLSLAAVLIVLGALCFGLLAYGLARAGVRSLAFVFVGAMLGCFAGLRLGGWTGLLFGCLLGVLCGNAATLLLQPRRPAVPLDDEIEP